MNIHDANMVAMTRREIAAKLIEGGYRPVPCAGKAVNISEWTTRNFAPGDFGPKHNIGIKTGDGIALVDIDVSNPEASAAIVTEWQRRHPGALQRTGKAPRTAFLVASDLTSKIDQKLPALGKDESGKDQKIEVLADGQQFVAYGIHPDTGQPYTWHGLDPLDTFLGVKKMLPFVSKADIRDFVEWVGTTYGTKPEGKTDTGHGGARGSGGFWRNVNDASLADLDAWVPALFPAAKKQATGGWRIASRDLGRDLEEDLSLHPDGIQDFGPEITMTPIDVVQQFGGAAWPKDAALWLCDKLGKDPAALGWQSAVFGPAWAATGGGQQHASGNRPGYLGIETAGAFCQRWQPPQYIVDGILPRGRVQALTAYTGHTKTTTAVHLALCVATGQPFGAGDVEQGAVLILAGENPDLVVGQFRAACLAVNVQPDTLPVHFHYGRFSVTEHGDALMRDAQAIRNLALIVPDTHQAFFEGDNDNDNMQALAAAQKWRPFAELQTRPTVLIPCHPSGKKPDRDNLVPRGGSAFMNELDGNFCLWRKGDLVTFHWQGKHRGPSFEPIELKLDLKTHPEIIDSKGREIPMPVVRPLMTIERMTAEREAMDADLRALLALRDNPTATVREVAGVIGRGKSQAAEIIAALKADGLIHRHARKWKLTAAGDEVLTDASL